jgi:hypothetical protein
MDRVKVSKTVLIGQIMQYLCEILGYHGGKYEHDSLVGHSTM